MHTLTPTNSSLSHIPEDARAQCWDVVVVGTGIGGSTLGHALARRGHAVLFIERGRMLFADPAVVRGTALVHQADPAERLRHGWWPTPFRNAASLANGTSFHPVGCGTGGSSAVFSMVMERLRPQDFTPRRFFPARTTAPCRKRGRSLTTSSPPTTRRRKSAIACVALPILSLQPVPWRCRPSRRHGNSPICSSCRPAACTPIASTMPASACLNAPGVRAPSARACRNDAEKNCLRPALELHGAHILPECEVTRLTASGRAVSTATCAYRGEQIEVRGRIFVLAANAYLTPRLLLQSRGTDQPHGLANSSGLVRRNLMLHATDQVFVRTIDPVETAPMGHGISLNDYYLVDGIKLGNLHAHPA